MNRFLVSTLCLFLSACVMGPHGDSGRGPYMLNDLESRAFGDRRLESFLQTHRPSSREELQQRVTRIGLKVAAESDRPGMINRLYVVEGWSLRRTRSSTARSASRRGWSI